MFQSVVTSDFVLVINLCFLDNLLWKSADVWMQCNWWQILAHVSPLPANRHAFKDAEELSAGCEEEFNQKIEDCEGNTDMSYEGSQFFT